MNAWTQNVCLASFSFFQINLKKRTHTQKPPKDYKNTCGKKANCAGSCSISVKMEATTKRRNKSVCLLKMTSTLETEKSTSALVCLNFPFVQRLQNDNIIRFNLTVGWWGKEWFIFSSNWWIIAITLAIYIAMVILLITFAVDDESHSFQSHDKWIFI